MGSFGAFGLDSRPLIAVRRAVTSLFTTLAANVVRGSTPGKQEARSFASGRHVER
jgi:hypothetical protein